ncbi:PilZ domain-containing protein [Sphingomonas dokdonensis]|uniref:PilZ domain protein n=1 Tax=Sphingomonas dokdonensis TaxID=344880 RepID=A0A245ZI32_9SPHN|nr:PilZ domain-containing protein [Sphingomonas dokdonensis]OWK29383.1 PilZ domain protein [Sphingomonas dokdonensis]
MSEADRSDEPAGVEAAPPDRAPRHSVFLSATVEHFGKRQPSTHRVRDLSVGGVRIDHAEGFVVGATVLVTVGALESVAATIVWVKDGAAGLKFAQQIDPQAARARAAVAPAPFRGQSRGVTAPAPTAGWMPNLGSPYRR